MTLQEIESEAAKLSSTERVALAVSLLDSLEEDVHDVSDEEILKHIKEADENPESLLTLDEVIAGLNRHGC